MNDVVHWSSLPTYIDRGAAPEAPSPDATDAIACHPFSCDATLSAKLALWSVT
jgi:hypothetical protein